MSLVSRLWEQIRLNYGAFESDIRSGTSDIYVLQMPGGQYTNLRQQARSLGIEHRWHEVAKAYSQVNRMFGDIIKVTPISKVVGDMALMMVTGGLSADDVMDPAHEIAFPESVVAFFAGEMGQPHGGFPQALQAKVLKGRQPLCVRPGQVLGESDLDGERSSVEQKIGRRISDVELASHLMYPDVFADFARHLRTNGVVSVVPTPTYFYGMTQGQEISVDIDRGKALVIRYLALGEPDSDGRRNVFFELNGQPRTVEVADKSAADTGIRHPKADAGNPDHVAAPMPGLIVSISVAEGQAVARGDVLLAIEAMKMETAVITDRDGIVDSIVQAVGTQVDAKDLLVVLNPED